MKEARVYRKLDDEKVECLLCAHNCRINPGKRGLCGVRENRDGTLYSLVYGKIIAEHVDPIEKKPLFHFLPGTRAYSIGTVGCNFRCAHCQNFEISQMPHNHEGRIAGRDCTPESIVAAAVKTGCQSIAYTYNEPTIFFEFAHDTAVLAQQERIKNVFVSNGYMSEATATRIAPYLDAINIDLKGFTDSFYKKICGARLQPVLDTIRRMKEAGVWLEVTTLVIPTLNDSDEELRNIARFIKSVGPDIPWHVTRFFPTYRLKKLPPTDLESLQRAREIGLEEGLHYVYEGNVPGRGSENTYCPGCGRVLIERTGYHIESRSGVETGRCPECGVHIPGEWG